MPALLRAPARSEEVNQLSKTDVVQLDNLDYIMSYDKPTLHVH